MTTPDLPDRSRSVTLSLAREGQWTLHHVLLHRINWETTETAPVFDDPPSVEVFQAFETLEAGKTSFTIAQLEAIQTVLEEYHHATSWWELERAQIEHLLQQITARLAQQRSATAPE